MSNTEPSSKENKICHWCLQKNTSKSHIWHTSHMSIDFAFTSSIKIMGTFEYHLNVPLNHLQQTTLCLNVIHSPKHYIFPALSRLKQTTSVYMGKTTCQLGKDYILCPKYTPIYLCPESNYGHIWVSSECAKVAISNKQLQYPHVTNISTCKE